MNREAVALGTPAYTIFSGRMGAVDERLIATGRLRVLADPSSFGAAQAGGEAGRAGAARPAAPRGRSPPGRRVVSLAGGAQMPALAPQIFG